MGRGCATILNGEVCSPELADKVAYVKRAGQTRLHHCHWPGCEVNVPPAKWGCSRHWFMLSKRLRDRIWATFRPGQETNWTPSREYVAVAREVQLWISIEESGL
jgi:hypothetical protein